MTPSRLLCIAGLLLAAAVCCAPLVARAAETGEPDLPSGVGEDDKKQPGEPDLPYGTVAIPGGHWTCRPE